MGIIKPKKNQIKKPNGKKPTRIKPAKSVVNAGKALGIIILSGN